MDAAVGRLARRWRGGGETLQFASGGDIAQVAQVFADGQDMSRAGPKGSLLARQRPQVVRRREEDRLGVFGTTAFEQKFGERLARERPVELWPPIGGRALDQGRR